MRTKANARTIVNIRSQVNWSEKKSIFKTWLKPRRISWRILQYMMAYYLSNEKADGVMFAFRLANKQLENFMNQLRVDLFLVNVSQLPKMNEIGG